MNVRHVLSSEVWSVFILFYNRYALGDLVEAERDYINDLTELIDQLDAEDPTKFKNQASISSELRDLAEFHRGLFHPELVNCLPSPPEVADAFMKWVRVLQTVLLYLIMAFFEHSNFSKERTKCSLLKQYRYLLLRYSFSARIILVANVC